MKRLLFISLALVVFITLGFYFFKPSSPNTQPLKQSDVKEEIKGDAQPEYQRQNISFLKFISSENCMYSLSSQEIEKLRSLNINGIRICPLYSLGTGGSLREDVPEFVIINLIKQAHKAGFAVFLEVNAGGKPAENGEPEYRYDDIEDVNKLYNIALHWAELAEREKVEFFSPLNEPDIMFLDNSLVEEWINKSQNLKHVFSGNLVLKLADIGPENIKNIENYDYLAFDIMWGDNRYEELKTHLDLAIEKGSRIKKKYNLKGFFFGELGTERARVDKSIQTEIFRTIFERTWNKVDGYCFLGWSNLEFRFKDNDNAKEVIREWYAKL
ncbi:MAG: hypothetical protein DRP13_00750 [Candidatus Aenigmatarchaeota archaeon]|nr:MAG: hypothetical protein DRP13_00750 [Candidatus Aenigmarchaeota archaeon]